MLYRVRQILIPIVLNGSRRKVLSTVVTESFSRSETYVDLDAFERRRVAKMEGNKRPRFGVIVSSFFQASPSSSRRWESSGLVQCKFSMKLQRVDLSAMLFNCSSISTAISLKNT